jgi:group I intron endonuclease
MEGIHKCIYMLISPSKKCYIGFTNNFKKRLQQHSRARGNCRAIHHSIKKYGWDNFLKVVVEVFDDDVTVEFLKEREMYWIAKHETLYPKGYNLTAGGDGGDKSEETRAKLSAAAKARSPETVAKHSEAMSRANKGRLVSAATRAKISASQMGHKGGKKAIIATDKGGNKRKFESLAGAARILSDENGELFRPNSISRCCLKKVKTHHGWTFEFVT